MMLMLTGLARLTNSKMASSLHSESARLRTSFPTCHEISMQASGSAVPFGGCRLSPLHSEANGTKLEGRL